MRIPNIVLAALTCFPALAVSASDCEPIVVATIAEMKAGSTNWDERSEALVRAAAGAACVKAYSGTYADSASNGEVRESEVEQADSAAPVVDETATNVQMDDATASVADEDSGWWPKLKRNNISASPSKKPYARKRD